ncbi:AAA family ATPase [Pseudofulvibacter geojedonensis]|uniref:AAA family ATPase n=1 Tax=Pseudofulvibacter geojedonensis TaxID=1123758 RepID=A0ABW3HZ71_9FLAO
MKRVILTGGPGTGKTTIISTLKKRGFVCFPEISREIILEAQKTRNIDQLFLSHPDEFNEKLLSGRIQQFKNCEQYKPNTVFIDRALPDIVAYNDYVKVSSSKEVINAVNEYRYDFVFIFPPWESIYKNDNERYESFEEAQKIHESLKATYIDLGYEVCEVPIGNVEERANYILNVIEYS